MILVDSSVWIDYFAGSDKPQTDRLHNLLDSESLAVGDLILTEVLQGFRSDADYKSALRLFDALTVYNLLGKDMAVRSAQNFRLLRKRGVTVRKTADVIIASFCIENGLPLLFTDRGFMPFVEHLSLQVA